MEGHVVPWNSDLEIFSKWQNRTHFQWNSIEFHGTVTQKFLTCYIPCPLSIEFYGVPWNYYLPLTTSLTIPGFSIELREVTKFTYGEGTCDFRGVSISPLDRGRLKFYNLWTGPKGLQFFMPDRGATLILQHIFLLKSA